MAEATESASRLAAAHNIDLSKVDGTGADDKVINSDVEAVIEAIEIAEAHGRTSVDQRVPTDFDPDEEVIEGDDPALVAFVKKVASQKATSRARLARDARKLLDDLRS